MPALMMKSLRRPARGVGMIEVLIALLVVALGVVGLARFQGTFTKTGAAAKSRVVANQLAREKLDDLKSFTQLNSGGAGVFGYDEIAANTGGAEKTDGTLVFPSGALTVSNTAYQRTWTSTGYYYCGGNAAPSTTNCSGAAAKTRPDFKALRVTVAWTDADGASQTLVLDDAAASVDPRSAATALVTGVSASPPMVPYTPGEAPNVIAIDVGDGQKKETTNPTPTLNKKGQAIINTIARYETIRFSEDTNTITREEFTTLNCSCTNNGTGEGFNALGQKVTKTVGVPADRDQAPECGVCCRDHHDNSASCNLSSDVGKKGCFDPLRPAADYSNGNHNHYNANGQLANARGDTYREACRLKRVDGDLRVVQDWNLISIASIPESFFASGGTVNTSNVERYGSYVKELVEAALTGEDPPAPIWDQESTVARASTKPLVARGIYLDYLDDDTREEYADRIAAGDETVFQVIPFYEVNLTKLAQWRSNDNLVATVRNDQLVTEQEGQDLYSRGDVTGVAVGVTDVLVTTTVSNTGIINEFITTDPQDGTTRITEAHEVTVPGANPSISGTILPAPSGGVTVTASNGGSCTYTTGSYSCTVPFNWDGVITPTSSGAVFSPPSRTHSAVTSSLTLQNFSSTVSTTSFAISGTITPAVAGTTISATTGASCTYDAAGTYRCVVPQNWTGTVTPSASGFTFNPTGRNYSAVGADITGQDYASSATATTFTITGRLSPIPSSATITASTGGTCTYGGSGTYSCTVPSGWSGTVTPTTPSVSYTPASRSYTNVAANQVNQDYNGATASFTISGIVAPNVAGTTVTANNGGGPCTYTAGSPNGTYSCTVPNLWSGGITPSATNTTFEPSVRTYSNVTSNFTTENYTSGPTPSVTFTLTGTISPISKGVATITPTTGATCETPVKATLSCNNNCTYNYRCTVTISQGTTWSGSLTPGNTGSGNKTYTPATKSYSAINSNQTQNFTCAGGGC